jgi:hypothetical protein
LVSIIGYALYKYKLTINENTIIYQARNIEEIMDIKVMDIGENTKFEVKGDEVYMSGSINSKTYNQFVKLIEENPQVKTVVQLNIEGSFDRNITRKVAYFIRERKLNTKLLSYSDINSGAVDLFLAGVKRTMERGAYIEINS